MLAAITKAQEFLLTPDEATLLAQASANVARHYDIQMAAKTIDWTNLMMALGTVYGTRLMALRLRVQAEKKTRPSQEKSKPANGAQNPEFAGVSGGEEYLHTHGGAPGFFGGMQQ